MPEEIKVNQPVQNVINIPMNVQLVYANGANINLSQSDVQISFSVNGRPVIATVMPLMVAKTLQNSLQKALLEYERKTNSTIPDIQSIAEQLKKS